MEQPNLLGKSAEPLVDTSGIKEHKPALYSAVGQFATVDHLDKGNTITLVNDE